MAHYVARVRSPLTVDEAFAYMADFRNFAEWDPGVDVSTQVRGDGPGPAAAYDVTVNSGRGSTLRYDVVEYDAPNRIKIIAKGSWYSSIDVVEVARSGGETVVVYDATLQLPWYLRPADPLLARVFNRIGDAAAEGMKRALDGTIVR